MRDRPAGGPGPRRRASVAPMPCSIGSPLASTQVRAGTPLQSSSTSASIGDGQARCTAVVGGSSASCRCEPTITSADEHGGARVLAEPAPAVGADPHDRERRRAHATRDVSTTAAARAARNLRERRPVHVQEARLHAPETKPSLALGATRRKPPRRAIATWVRPRLAGSDPRWRVLPGVPPARSGTRARAPARRPPARAWR